MTRGKAELSRMANDLTRLIDTANAPIFGIDANGLVNEWNRKAAEITGYSKEEVIGQHMTKTYITEVSSPKPQQSHTAKQPSSQATAKQPSSHCQAHAAPSKQASHHNTHISSSSLSLCSNRRRAARRFIASSPDTPRIATRSTLRRPTRRVRVWPIAWRPPWRPRASSRRRSSSASGAASRRSTRAGSPRPRTPCGKACSDRVCVGGRVG